MTKVINPQDYSYSFRLGIYDCFKVLTGRCSLELSEEEYKYFKPFTSTYKDGSIDYCREFARYLIKNDLFKQDTGITMFQN
ncbi:hypothetical protein [Bacillus sp. FSL K6-3431]|uniref:hypothetical protein n=1 Tax=Bacillus sp. FSL K6-3431 TaxID=2921500 RepID=UPI0030FA3343